MGNQLFNYASLFGIAWRNGRVPLWPDGPSLVRKAFNIRIPIDVNNAIAKVGLSKNRRIISGSLMCNTRMYISKVYQEIVPIYG